MMGFETFGGYGFMGGFFGPFLMILFWGLIIWGIVMFVQTLTKQGTATTVEKKNGAVEILNERYAKGEITKEEYEEKKKNIQS